MALVSGRDKQRPTGLGRFTGGLEQDEAGSRRDVCFVILHIDSGTRAPSSREWTRVFCWDARLVACNGNAMCAGVALRWRDRWRTASGGMRGNHSAATSDLISDCCLKVVRVRPQEIELMISQDSKMVASQSVT